MFVRDEDADRNGCGLMCYVDPNPTIDQLMTVLGPPSWGSEPDKGYDHEYTFVGPENVTVTLYDRYGVWRVGSTCPQVAERFRGWLVGLLTPAVKAH
jgi:hypothetical protein